MEYTKEQLQETILSEWYRLKLESSELQDFGAAADDRGGEVWAGSKTSNPEAALKKQKEFDENPIADINSEEPELEKGRYSPVEKTLLSLVFQQLSRILKKAEVVKANFDKDPGDKSGPPSLDNLSEEKQEPSAEEKNKKFSLLLTALEGFRLGIAVMLEASPAEGDWSYDSEASKAAFKSELVKHWGASPLKEKIQDFMKYAFPKDPRSTRPLIGMINQYAKELMAFMAQADKDPMSFRKPKSTDVLPRTDDIVTKIQKAKDLYDSLEGLLTEGKEELSKFKKHLATVVDAIETLGSEPTRSQFTELRDGLIAELELKRSERLKTAADKIQDWNTLLYYFNQAMVEYKTKVKEYKNNPKTIELEKYKKQTQALLVKVKKLHKALEAHFVDQDLESLEAVFPIQEQEPETSLTPAQQKTKDLRNQLQDLIGLLESDPSEEDFFNKMTQMGMTAGPETSKDEVYNQLQKYFRIRVQRAKEYIKNRKQPKKKKAGKEEEFFNNVKYFRKQLEQYLLSLEEDPYLSNTFDEFLKILQGAVSGLARQKLDDLGFDQDMLASTDWRGGGLWFETEPELSNHKNIKKQYDILKNAIANLKEGNPNNDKYFKTIFSSLTSKLLSAVEADVEAFNKKNNAQTQKRKKEQEQLKNDFAVLLKKVKQIRSQPEDLLESLSLSKLDKILDFLEYIFGHWAKDENISSYFYTNEPLPPVISTKIEELPETSKNALSKKATALINPQGNRTKALKDFLSYSQRLVTALPQLYLKALKSAGKKEKEAKKPKPNQKKPEISQKERLTKRWHSLNTRLKKGKDTISDELRSSIRKMLQQAYKLGKEKQWDEAEKQLDRVDNNLSQQSLEEKYHRLLLPLIKAELKRTQHG